MASADVATKMLVGTAPATLCWPLYTGSILLHLASSDSQTILGHELDRLGEPTFYRDSSSLIVRPTCTAAFMQMHHGWNS